MGLKRNGSPVKEEEEEEEVIQCQPVGLTLYKKPRRQGGGDGNWSGTMNLLFG